MNIGFIGSIKIPISMTESWLYKNFLKPIEAI